MKIENVIINFYFNFKNQNMKNSILITLFSLFITVSFSQTPSFSVYYFDVKQGSQASIAEAYDEFWGNVEFESGGLY